MQTFICYVNAGGTLGAVRDSYNAKSATAPVLTLGVAACLKLRLFKGDGDVPYPIAELASVASWQFVMDNDFNASTPCKIAADHEHISVASVTETSGDETRTYTEVTIPIPAMNTQELVTLIGAAESIALNGELVGFDSNGDDVFVLQIKGFTVRNRISGSGTPTEIDPEYLTASQVRALLRTGFDVIFAASAAAVPSDWHSAQLATDTVWRIRLAGDPRTWTDGAAEDCGWSCAMPIVTGPEGQQGPKGDTGATGPQGPTGAAGSTPVRGTDYWTASDIAAIQTYCEDAIMNGAW